MARRKLTDKEWDALDALRFSTTDAAALCKRYRLRWGMDLASAMKGKRDEAAYEKARRKLKPLKKGRLRKLAPTS